MAPNLFADLKLQDTVKLMVTKKTIYTTQATLLTNLKNQNTPNTNGYQGNNLHNINHYSNKHQTEKQLYQRSNG